MSQAVRHGGAKKAKRGASGEIPFAHLKRHTERQGIRRTGEKTALERILRDDQRVAIGRLLHSAMAFMANEKRATITRRDLALAAQLKWGIQLAPRAAYSHLLRDKK